MNNLIATATAVVTVVLVTTAIKVARISDNGEVIKNCKELYNIVYTEDLFGSRAHCISNMQKFGPVFNPTRMED